MCEGSGSFAQIQACPFANFSTSVGFSLWPVFYALCVLALPELHMIAVGVPAREGRENKMDVQPEWALLSEMGQFQGRIGVQSARYKPLTFCQVSLGREYGSLRITYIPWPENFPSEKRLGYPHTVRTFHPHFALGSRNGAPCCL